MSKRFIKVLGTAALLVGSSLLHAQQAEKTASPSGAQAYIVSPANGATVGSTFTVVFGLKGMGVAPAGVQANNTGHHHLLVDGVQLPDLNIPLGSNVSHFGGGQTETSLTLTPGQHTLQLILGDHLHIPHNPAVVSEKITINVQ
ncbi:MAG: DUF4399 domain-containing protein [Pseudomonadales bacterium]|nr:DUF4399 domain-containing protein [Pseudomonadales bacterium]MCP5330982.1 DUF4399 domain-containing protein [Pseudomonadales bacterium]MCP5344612.1 DUF4399 domain-containing protein [Pseudomonadales bacterium]